MIKSIFRMFAPKITLREILETHYQGYSRVSLATFRRYRCELGRWERICGDLPVNRIEPEHFVQFRDTCTAEGLAPSSIEGSVKVVKILLRYAKDRGWLTSLPVWGKPLPIEEPDVSPATLSELSKLYDASDVAERIGKRLVPPSDAMRAFLVLEYWTGIRGQNLVADLAWEDVKTDCIRFRQSKTGKKHIFPMHPIVTRHLELIHGMDDDRVFGLRSLQHVNWQLKRVCEAAGVRKLTTNHIREACFTQWTLADETAGKIVHGCGLPSVMQRHYLGRLRLLEAASGQFAWPAAMSATVGEQSGLRVG